MAVARGVKKNKKPIRKGRQLHVTGHQVSTVSGCIYGDNVPKQFISRKAGSELCFLLLEAHHSDASSLFFRLLGHHGRHSAMPAETKCSFNGLFALTRNITGQSVYCCSSNQSMESQLVSPGKLVREQFLRQLRLRNC